MTLITDQLKEHADYLRLLYDEARARNPNQAASVYDQVTTMLDRLEAAGPTVTNAAFSNTCHKLQSIQ